MRCRLLRATASANQGTELGAVLQLLYHSMILLIRTGTELAGCSADISIRYSYDTIILFMYCT